MTAVQLGSTMRNSGGEDRMSFMLTLKKIFSTGTETRDHHPDEKFVTHYYKGMQKKVLHEVESMLNGKKNFNVASVSEERGEIIVRVTGKKKVFLVATVIMVSPNRTSVDFSASTDTILFTDFGYSRRFVTELYKELDPRLHFLGKGLGDKLIK